MCFDEEVHAPPDDWESRHLVNPPPLDSKQMEVSGPKCRSRPQETPETLFRLFPLAMESSVEAG